MIERLIYIALKAGVAEVQADLSILERYFLEEKLLEPDEVVAIRTLFEAEPPQVQHGYARADTEVPLYAIVLANEDESEEYLGDEGGIDEETGTDNQPYLWSHQYNTLVYTDHPDASLYFYHLAKLFLLRARAFFLENNVHSIRYSGADLAPDPRYIPEHLFARRLTMHCESYLVNTFTPLRATSVRGIHVSDITGVVANVTPVTTEE